MVAGVTAGVLSTFVSADVAALAIACLSIAVALDAGRVRRLIVIGGLVAVAAYDGACARERAMASPLAAWINERAPTGRLEELVRVEGTIAEDASVGDEGVRLAIDVTRLITGSGAVNVGGRLRATVSGGQAVSMLGRWTRGRAVNAPVYLRTLDIWRDPGSASERWQRLHQSFDAAGSIKSAALVSVTPGPWWTEAEANVRAFVRASVARYLPPPSAQSAAIVTAILIGDRAGLGTDVQRKLQAAGTYHVIAISGGNIALVTALCFGIGRLTFRSARLPALITIVAVVAYASILGDDPSIRRAVAAAVLYFALGLAGVTPRAIDLLATVTLAIALVDPLVVIDASAWLSFGATAGIVVAASRIARRVGPPTGVSSLAARVWTTTSTLLSATVAAELALLPIAAGQFSRVSVAGLGLNFVAIPAMSVVEIAGAMLVACAAWCPPAARAAAFVADEAARAIVSSAGLLDAWPWLSWRVPPTSIAWTVVYYAAAPTCLWTALSRRQRLGAAAIGSLAGVVIAAGIDPIARAPAAGHLRLTLLDVGQGEAIVLQLPGGRSVLIDAGGLGAEFDIGGRVVTPALWALGVRRLDWLLFTHPDGDHIGGALSVAGDLRPREIWEGVPVATNADRASLHAAAFGRGIAWRALQAGDYFEIAGARLDVVHPPLPDWERPRSRNDDSVVLRVRIDDVEILLTGDAGAEFERVFAAGDAAPIRILKVGHHGSRSSTSQALLTAYRPHVALISAGRGNLFGHPAPEVLARLAAIGTTTFRTDRDGAITIDTDGRSVAIDTWTGRRLTIEARDVGAPEGPSRPSALAGSS